MKPLQPGDLIAIVAPAKAIEESHITFAKALFESRGYRVQVGAHCLGSHHYFSGTDIERASDLQQALDNPEVKAIICARGGYGCVRILDHLQWAGFIREPKWLVGFSDVTVLHQHIGMLELPSIHASMPLNFQENTPEAINSLFDALEGKQLTYDVAATSHNKRGEATGKLVGGNLSILYSLLGTDDSIDYTDCILFIEDLAEQLYHIDRMFYAFAKAGVLDKLKGLVVGGMTDLKDTAVPFGQDIYALILSHFTYRNIPIAFDFPAGHIDDNRALIIGAEVSLEVADRVRLTI
jgi:muramoyltetrapeptide carboxypeptidase